MEVNDYIRLKLTHAIHTSERLSFRACRRRWNWLFHEHWYPTTTAKPLEFGSAFHKAMEHWYDPMTWDKDPETRETLAILAFVNTTNEQKYEYIKNNAGYIDPIVEADYNERVELGRGMIRYHCRNVSPKLDRTLRPVRVEIEFEVPVLADQEDQTSTLWCKCKNCKTMWRNSDYGARDHDDWTKERYEFDRTRPDPLFDGSGSPGEFWTKRYWVHWRGLPVTYGGRIDCLMEDEHGRWWIVDWKTASRLTGQEAQDAPDEFILLDDQITSYCWALWTLDIPIAGFIHHEIKKAFPLEPEPLKNQYVGKWYSVNRQQGTSYDLYLQTIKDGDPTGLASGAYDEFLGWLKEEGPRYYSRKQVERSETELRNAGRNIYLEATEMIREGLPLYPSPGRFGCTFCAYRQPCIGMNRDEDVDYLFASTFEKRPHRYWETRPPSTESKGGQ